MTAVEVAKGMLISELMLQVLPSISAESEQIKKGDVLVPCRDVSTGTTGSTAVAPKLSDTLTLFRPGGGQILPTPGVVAPTFSPGLRPCTACRQGTLQIMLVLDVGYIGVKFYLESPNVMKLLLYIFRY